MGIFKNKEAVGETAESDRMRPEDLLAPTPDRSEQLDSGVHEPKQDKVEEANGECIGVEGTGNEAGGETTGNPEQPKNEGPGKVIAFAYQKGGVAKTATALNLAVAFKESGHRVLAVDMDPQGNLTMSQGIDPDKV